MRLALLTLCTIGGPATLVMAGCLAHAGSPYASATALLGGLFVGRLYFEALRS